MNVAVGGSFAGPPDASTQFPTNFLIDYVVVRQQRGMVGFGGTTSQGTPAYVAPLAGTLGTLFVVFVLLGVAFVLVRKRRMLHGNMRRESETGSLDSNTTLSTLLYIKTGNASYDFLLKKYISLIEIPANNLQLSA